MCRGMSALNGKYELEGRKAGQAKHCLFLIAKLTRIDFLLYIQNDVWQFLSPILLVTSVSDKH